MAAVSSIAGIMGTIALVEGVMALLEHVEGDPEADVQSALQSLAAKNQRRAFSLAAGEVAGQENVEEKFARFNEIPSRVLTEAALARSPGPPVTGSSALLDMVSSRLGVSPQQLNQVSHPSRVGDMSSIMRQFGKPTRGQ